MNELILFASTFALVFGLGLQSLNVNGGHYVAAFLTSFVIGIANMILLKLGPDANATEIIAFISGGPFGIVCSMWAHRRTIGRRKHRGIIESATEPPRDGLDYESVYRALKDEQRQIPSPPTKET